ncbi:AraC family transcriptional regulator [Shewanella gaetbuli]|uniref:AraC family transcriptional regulator n=1 Tax=Shewanella gaetbuli TaxID=220752 RepID=A0A9X2CJA2_9GAMM|nr:GyrI-like domain-containing protein [Shewanella gaetbuli]MCL1143927.1 AraC family transcriptional regulator [Shewanella gaetbuli]
MELLSEKFERVLAYIDTHLNTSLSLDTLADIAQVPQCHFDNIFMSLFHSTSSQYIQLLRNLEAAHQLGFDKNISIMQVAQSVGYVDEATFTTEFTASIGQSPSDFQLHPDWGNFFVKQQPLKTLSEGHETLSADDVNVEVIRLETIPCIAIKHQASEQYLPQTIQSMRAFRQAHKLSPQFSRTFNLIHQFQQNASGQINMDIAVSVTAEQKAQLTAVINDSEHFYFSEIPQGQYATFLHTGTDEELKKKLNYLFASWLSLQHKTLANYPLFFERLNILQQDNAQTRVFLGVV